MRFLLLLVLYFSASCSHKPVQDKQDNKVTIIKQWHASAKINTQDIKAAKNIPQYQNQKAIYDYVKEAIAQNENAHVLLLAEGCDAGVEIDENFATSFNGWNMKSLKAAVSRDDYDDIVTALPLKLKAKFSDKVTALCADDTALMEKNQLALSDARAFIGFYMRLKEHASQPKKFAIYHQALEESQGKKITDPVEFSRINTLKSLDDFEKYLKQRNTKFAQALAKHVKQRPILIVGGLHAQDLVDQLSALEIEGQIVALDSYPSTSDTLADDLREQLELQK